MNKRCITEAVWLLALLAGLTAEAPSGAPRDWNAAPRAPSALPFDGAGSDQLLLGSPTSVDDRAPPLCTDPVYLARIQSHYGKYSEDKRRISSITDVTQTLYGPTAAIYNRFANARRYLVNSRYCRGTAVLDDGASDTLYWGLDWVNEGDGHRIQWQLCSLRHDNFNDKCRIWRPAEFPAQ